MTLLVWGFSIPSYAGAPSLSLPSLPKAAALPSTPVSPTNSAFSGGNLPPKPPGLDFNTPQDQLAAAKAIKEAPQQAPQPVDAAKNNQPAQAATQANNFGKPRPPSLPGNVGARRGRVATGGSRSYSSGRGDDNSPVEIPAAHLKKAQKTWEAKLAPSYPPVETKFIYRRVVLPNEIYRDSYTGDNRGLPVRQTMEQYEQYFLNAVARNQLDGVRAFLNAGIDPNLTTPYGESALSLAMRYHAEDVARLLVARGAYEGAPVYQAAPISYAPAPPPQTYAYNNSAPATYYQYQAQQPAARTSAYLPNSRYHR